MVGVGPCWRLRDWLLARLAEQPDLTVRALAAEPAGRGIVVSPNTVWALLRRARHRFKKTATIIFAAGENDCEMTQNLPCKTNAISAI